jgi:hypothetical protein
MHRELKVWGVDLGDPVVTVPILEDGIVVGSMDLQMSSMNKALSKDA